MSSERANRRLVDAVRLLNHKVGTAYRKYKGVSSKNRLKDREEVRKMLKTICKHIGDELVEREGGVQIEGLGYFFVWKIPRKMTYNLQVRGEGLKEHYNHHSGHYMYSPTFLPVVSSRKPYQYWKIENTFERSLKKRIKDKIVKGFKYKMYPHSLQKLNTK